MGLYKASDWAHLGGYLLASTLWWISLVTAPGRTIFWLLAPYLLLVLALLVLQLRSGRDSSQA